MICYLVKNATCQTKKFRLYYEPKAMIHKKKFVEK